MKRNLSVLLGLAILALAGAAKADITLCNRYSQDIWMAYGEHDTNPYYCGGDWAHDTMISGWWHATPNQCVKVQSGCICNTMAWIFGNCPGNWISYYAETGTGVWWGGSGLWGCTPWTAFNYECTQASNSGSCPNGRWLNYGMMSYDYPICNYTFNFNP